MIIRGHLQEIKQANEMEMKMKMNIDEGEGDDDDHHHHRNLIKVICKKIALFSVIKFSKMKETI